LEKFCVLWFIIFKIYDTTWWRIFGEVKCEKESL
jgi:hypothetical protein